MRKWVLFLDMWAGNLACYVEVTCGIQYYHATISVGQHFRVFSFVFGLLWGFILYITACHFWSTAVCSSECWDQCKYTCEVTNSFNLHSGSNYQLCSSVCIHQKLSIPIESFSIGCDQIVSSCRTFCTTSVLPFPFACSTLINTKGITSYICPSYHSYSCHSWSHYIYVYEQ